MPRSSIHRTSGGLLDFSFEGVPVVSMDVTPHKHGACVAQRAVFQALPRSDSHDEGHCVSLVTRSPREPVSILLGWVLPQSMETIHTAPSSIPSSIRPALPGPLPPAAVVALPAVAHRPSRSDDRWLSASYTRSAQCLTPRRSGGFSFAALPAIRSSSITPQPPPVMWEH